MAGELQSNERLFCWEQVERINPLFRVSQVFAPPGQAERLLPLYALFAAVEQLCAQASDAGPAQRKLDWWRGACLASDPSGSDHPILKELVARDAMPVPDVLGRLFDGAERRLDGSAPADGQGLEDLCREIGLAQGRVELDSLGEDPDNAAAAASAAGIGLAQLLRESLAHAGAGRFWWLPLNLLARHGTSRAELEQNLDGPNARLLFGEVFELARGWGGALPPAPSSMPSASRHLAVHGSLQCHAWRRLRRRPPSSYASVLRKVGLPELLRAWQCARRVSRP